MKDELQKDPYVAVATNDLKTVQAMTAAGFSHDSLWYHGRSTIHLAIDERKPKILQYLLEAGVNPDVQTEQFSETPLHLAAGKGYADMVKMLLAHGADVSIKNKFDCTPLYKAVCGGHVEIASLLVSAGADIHDVPERLGNLLSAGSKNDKMTEYLLELGIDANEFRGGMHPLAIAVRQFVTAKRDPSSRRWCHTNPRNIELLLAAGADPNLPVGAGIGKEFEGKTILEVAQEVKISPAIIKMLSGGVPSQPTPKPKSKAAAKPQRNGTPAPASIAEAWKQLKKTLSKKAPQVPKSLARKATEKQIERLRQDVKQEVPEELIELLRIHNGQLDPSPYLIPAQWTPHQYRLLSVDDILIERQVWRELLAAGEFRGYSPNCDPGVRSAWFSLDWIPLAVDGAGNSLCVDANPLKKGTVGQIVSVDHETPDRKRIAASLKEFLVMVDQWWGEVGG